MKKIIRNILILAVAVLAFYLFPIRELNVQPQYQYPNMPNGCEVTALDMLMKYNGFDVSKEFLNDNYLNKTDTYNADPNTGYIGNPYSKSKGFYCYAGPIADCANKYFRENNISKMAKDRTGMSVFGVLNQIIFRKKPVAVWYTVDDKKPEYGKASYTTPSGKQEPLYSNLHCVVVNGVGRGMVSIIDPIRGQRAVNIVEFTKLYMQMGQRAVVI